MKKLLSTMILAAAAVLPLSAADEPTFWGYVIGSSNWGTDYGLYNFTVANPMTANALYTDDNFFPNSGASYQDGIFYAVNYSEASWFSSESATVRKINTETWQQEGDDISLTLPDQLNLVAIETAHSIDGKTYGIFRTGTAGEYEIGTVDYSTMTRTTIGTTNKYYVALGITSDNKLYGIAVEGSTFPAESKLYQISLTDGSETLIGSTGVSVGGAYTDPKDYPHSGEIDQSSNTFYWSYYSGVYGETSALYTVDLNTAKATKVSDMPNGEQVVGMTFPVQAAQQGTPAPADSLKATFADGSLSGNVSFFVPDTTATGETLTDSLNYELKVGDQTINGKAKPGTTVSQDVTATAGGQTTIRVVLSNASGKSRAVSTSLWIGLDYPAAPSDVTASLTNDSIVNVSWTAPTAGEHNGYIGTLLYNVYRVSGSDTTAVADSIAATEVKDTLTLGDNAHYKYLVEAINGTLTGAKAESNEFVAGKAYSVPFTDEFDANTKREYYTTIDANHDGVTIARHYTEAQFGGWIPAQDYEEMQYNSNNASQAADDWFITPEIHLEAGKIYSFAFDVKSSYGSASQTFEVKYGNQPEVAALTNEVIPVTSTNVTDYKTFSKEFTVSADGDYNFGIHVLTAAANEIMYFDNIVVKIAADPAAPDSVTNLKVTPDSTGLTKATISYTAPTKTIDGQDLSAITKVEILRNDNIIATETTVAPGQTISYEDPSAPNGYNNYTVIAYNDKGNGLKAHKDSVYVGVDAPLPPTNLILADNDSTVSFKWNDVAKVGQNGFVVRPQDVQYQVVELDDSYEWSNELVEDLDSTAFSYDFNTTTGDQDVKRWGVRAHNAAGWSDFAYGRLIIGAPYNLPFKESFATGVSHGLTWMEGPGNFGIVTDEACDSDAGAVAYTPDEDGETTSLNLGKLSMKLAENPVLTFSYKGLTANDTLKVNVWQPDGTTTTVATFDGAAADWTKARVDLSQFAGTNYIILKFAATGTKGQRISLDDIEVNDLLSTDLAISLDAPDEAPQNGTAKVKVTVSNVGAEAVSDYSVSVTAADGTPVTVTADTALEPGAERTFEIDVPVTGEVGSSVELKAEIVCDDDLNPDNDAATAMVTLTEGSATAINGITVNSSNPQNVYRIDGSLVRRNATTLNGLAPGLYIINGKKVTLK